MYVFDRKAARLLHIPAFALGATLLMGVDCCDLDGDGQCDDQGPCEEAEGHDDDLDGICSAVDNCPDTFNPDQLDSNFDGVGDACQTLPLEPSNEPFVFMGLGTYIGEYGGQVGDIDGDGHTEILISGGIGMASTLEWDGQDYVHDQVFTAVGLVESLSSADLDGDGVHELFVSSLGRVYRLDGLTGQVEMAAPSRQVAVVDTELADIDGDGELELVGIIPDWDSPNDYTRIIVMDTETLTIKWASAPYEGLLDLAVGDVLTSAPGLEIVANNGVVLGGISQEEEWVYPFGFGREVDTGDVDGDGQEVIVAITRSDLLTVFDANLGTPLWEEDDLGDLASLLVANIDDTPRAEIITGAGEWGYIFIYDGLTRQESWRIDAFENGTTELYHGDPDQDGSMELLWGIGASTSGEDHLVVADIARGEYDWYNPFQIDGYFVPGGLGDFNGDGALEFLVGASSTSSGYRGPIIFAFDQSTTAQVADTPSLRSRPGYGLTMATGDYNDDGVTDLALGAGQPIVELYDVFGDSTLWTSDSMSADVTLVRFEEVDGAMALVGAFGKDLHVFRPPATAAVLSATSPGTYINDFDFCDLNGDGTQDLVVAAGSLWTFEVTPDLIVYTGSKTDRYYSGVRCADLDGDGGTELVVWERSNYLAILDGETLGVEVEMLVSNSYELRDLELVDVDMDGTMELAIAGFHYRNNEYLSWVELVDSATLETLSTSQVIKDYVEPNGLLVEDLQGDGDLNLEIGGRGTFQVVEMPLSLAPSP